MIEWLKLLISLCGGLVAIAPQAIFRYFIPRAQDTHIRWFRAALVLTFFVLGVVSLFNRVAHERNLLASLEQAKALATQRDFRPLDKRLARRIIPGLKAGYFATAKIGSRLSIRVASDERSLEQFANQLIGLLRRSDIPAGRASSVMATANPDQQPAIEIWYAPQHEALASHLMEALRPIMNIEDAKTRAKSSPYLARNSDSYVELVLRGQPYFHFDGSVEFR